MRKYELIFIVHPELDENAFKETVERVSSWVTESGGEISNTEIWGKRQLAYPIQKQNEGQYVLMETIVDPTFCTQLERNLKLQEPIMRYLLVSKEN